MPVTGIEGGERSAVKLNANTVVAVSALVACIQELVEDNFIDVHVQGELSNVSKPPSGHRYFTLKDHKAQLRCVMFRSHARALAFDLEEGTAVICRGRVSLYSQRGDLQLVVESLEPAGVGDLQLAFDRLKNKLQAEGLFAEAHKKALPPFPQRIGVVTSKNGAAIRDILNVLQRRSAGVSVLLRSAAVQGESAAADIARAVDELNREGSSDVLIVGRGGGSREDLWAFNEEIVARAIFASRIPVISAVGHEVDFSIADMVADCRAPTPSAAAELVVRNRLDLERHLDQLTLRLVERMRGRLALLRTVYLGLRKRLRPPSESIGLQRYALQRLTDRLERAAGEMLETRRHRLESAAGRLEALSPLRVLERGYAVVTQRQNGKVVYAQDQVALGECLRIRLAQGELGATVTEKETQAKK